MVPRADVAVAALREGLPVAGEARLYVAWPAKLDGSADAAAFAAVRGAGGTPWVLATFETPSPVLDHLERFEVEIKALTELVRGHGDRLHVQVAWAPASGELSAKELGFLFKRAAVAVNGAEADARILLGPLPADPLFLRALYAEEIAAYADGLVFGDVQGEKLNAAIAAVQELDPGKPVSLLGLPWPEDASTTLAKAAQASAAGVAVSLFAFGERSAADLAPLKLLAREFQGDLSLDPYTQPTGAVAAWAFVRRQRPQPAGHRRGRRRRHRIAAEFRRCPTPKPAIFRPHQR